MSSFILDLLQWLVEGVSIQVVCFFIMSWSQELGLKAAVREPQDEYIMLQTATVYKDGEGFKPKEYYFKIQDIIGNNKKRHTFAKCKIDLAKYCSCKSNETQDVTIPIRCLFLPHHTAILLAFSDFGQSAEGGPEFWRTQEAEAAVISERSLSE